MIEDQVAPKRCGHTKGKAVVDREEAETRIRAAVDARDEGADILIMARTDARQTHGFEEALHRSLRFAELGVDLVFPEAPESQEEMETLCREIPTPVMANMVEGGKTPLLSPTELEALGYALVAYPLTLLSASIAAMEQALEDLAAQRAPERLLSFETLKERVGFLDYYREDERYRPKG